MYFSSIANLKCIPLDRQLYMYPRLGTSAPDGSILLKCLLETRLKFASFETLDDLLGLRIQKLWPKNNKINDLSLN